MSEHASPDPARQAERTILAHWRTELAVAVVAALIVRQAGSHAERLVVAAIGSVALVAVVAAGWMRQRHLAHPLPRPAPRTVAITVAGLLVLQLLAIIVVV